MTSAAAAAAAATAAAPAAAAVIAAAAAAAAAAAGSSRAPLDLPLFSGRPIFSHTVTFCRIASAQAACPFASHDFSYVYSHILEKSSYFLLFLCISFLGT